MREWNFDPPPGLAYGTPPRTKYTPQHARPRRWLRTLRRTGGAAAPYRY